MKMPVLLLGIVLLAIVLLLAGLGAHPASSGYRHLGRRQLPPLRILRTSQAPKTVRAVKAKQS